MKSIWYTYRIRIEATKGTMALGAAFDALQATGAIYEVEFIRATSAKEEKS